MANNERLALITGASKGIGAEAAKLFAQHGYHIVINYLNNTPAAK